MKRWIPVVLALLLLLTACAGEAPAETTTAPTETTAAPVETTAAPTTEPTTVPTEPPVVYRHPITGRVLEEPFTVRPVAVVTNNSRDAMPQHGTSQADVMYEILAEGGTTRHLVVYTDLGSVSALGSIRSARTYLQSLSRVYDAVLIHCGDSTHAAKQFKTGRYPHIDSMFYSIFYRDQNRLNSGYALEHTLFVKGEKLLALVSEDFSMVSERDSYGFEFADDVQPQGDDAATVTAHFIKNSKKTEFRYDAEKGAYSVYQHGRDYKDGNTNEKVYFQNVFVLHAKKSTVSSGHVFHELVGENAGYYICGGKISPIKWSRETEEDPFTYTYEDGSPVIMTPGTSYIAVIPNDGYVETK